MKEMVDVYVKRLRSGKELGKPSYAGDDTMHLGVIKAVVVLRAEGGIFLTITNKQLGKEIGEAILRHEKRQKKKEKERKMNMLDVEQEEVKS
jgi:hypothetical protein